MSISLHEIKESVCGEGADGRSRAITIVGAHRYNLLNTTEDPKVIAEFSSMEPVISLIIGKEVSWINMKFISDQSNNLKLFFRALERYLEETDKNEPDSEAVAFVTLIPLEFAGQYYISAVHPIMWALEPESAGEDMRTLRVAFFSEDVSFLESNLDDDFFDRALAAAKGDDDDEDDEEFLEIDRNEYGHSDRDDEFMDSDKYIADFSDDEDEENEDDDDDDSPTDRRSYVYH